MTERGPVVELDDSPTYPAPTQQMLRTGGVRVVVSKRVDDKGRLLFRGRGGRCSSCGRRIGLWHSGVVGAVETSSSSESAKGGDGGNIVS